MTYWQLSSVRKINQIGETTRERIVHVSQYPALKRSGVVLCGVSDAGAGFSFEAERWANGQVLMCYGGSGKVRIGEQWCDCAKGQAYLTPAGAAHAYRATGKGRWRVTWVMYDTATAMRVFRGHRTAALVRGNPMPVTWAIRGLYEQTLAQADDALMESWMRTIVMEAGAIVGGSAAMGHSAGDQLWQLWAAVDAEPGRGWALAELADRASVSSEHLRRLCRKQYGRSPMQQVTHLRMRQAGRLLVSTPWKIDEIAARLGYADRFGFSVAFARVMGRSPAEFRRIAVS